MEEYPEPDTEEFIEAGLAHAFGSNWQQFTPGSGSVRIGDAGVYVFYSPIFIRWKATVQAGMPITMELLQEVAEINDGLPMGTLTILPGEENGLLLWSYKVLPRWLDTTSRASANLLVDVSSNALNMVRMCRERLERFGGTPYTPDDLNTLMFI